MSNKAAIEKINGLESRVAELETELQTAETSIETLKAEAVTASETIASITSERDKATAELATAQTTIQDQESTITAANEKLATFDADVEARALLKVASIGFKGEVPETKSEPAPEKQDLSGLTGFAKVAAAFAAEKK